MLLRGLYVCSVVALKVSDAPLSGAAPRPKVDQDVETATVGTKRAVFSLELAAKRAAEQNKREQKGYKLQPIQKLDHLLEDDD